MKRPMNSEVCGLIAGRNCIASYRFASLIFGLFLTTSFAGNIPEGYSAQRYESLWKRSPFSLSSIVEEQAQVSGMAERYSLSGTFSVGEKDYVFVVNRANPTERFLVSKEPNAQGLSLESITRDSSTPPDPSKLTATIKQGEESGKITFDPALFKAIAGVAQPPIPAAPMPVQRMPNPTYNPGHPGAPGRTQIYRRPRIIAPPPGTAPTTPTKP